MMQKSMMQRIALFAAFAAFLLVSMNATATTYYVKTNGSNGATGTSWNSAWQTLGEVADRIEQGSGGVEAGDTVIVRDGTYSGSNNQLHISNAGGTQGSPITIRAELLGEFDPKPVLKNMDESFKFENGCQYIKIDSINIDGDHPWRQFSAKPNVTRWCRIKASSNITIQNCVWKYCKENFKIDKYSSKVVLRNNTLKGVGAPDPTFGGSKNNNSFVLDESVPHNQAIENYYPYVSEKPNNYRDFYLPALNPGNKGDALKTFASKSIFESNTIDMAGHSPVNFRGGKSVFRGNIVTNEWGEFTIDDKDPIPYGNRCAEFTYDKNEVHADGFGYNLIEKNSFSKAGASLDQRTTSVSSVKVQGQAQIFRYNFIYDNVYGSLSMVSGTTKQPIGKYNRVYNNVVYNNGGWSWKETVNTPSNHKYNMLANNIFFENHWDPHTGIGRTSYQGDFIFLNRLPVSTNEFFNNLSVPDGGGDTQVYLYSAVGLKSLTYAENNYGSTFYGNKEEDPKFTGNLSTVDLTDFQLAPGSPCIDAGAFLTETVGSGSGTTMTVDDVHWFFPGIEDVGADDEVALGDEIQLEGQTATARITNIDYNNKELTLDSSLSWSNGQGVFLTYNGSAPDMGAWESSSGGGGPTYYTLTVANGSGDGSYEENDVVNISADSPAPGYYFTNWSTSDGGSFGNANASSTTYTMPGNNATVTANYAADGGEETFNPEADAYVRNVSGTYNQDTNLLRIADGSGGNERVSYIRFDLSTMSESTCSAALLKLCASTANSVTITLHEVANDSWNEASGSFNWSGKPAIGDQIGSGVTVSSSGWVTFASDDLKTFVSQQLAGDDEVSVALQSSASDGKVTVFHDLESANAPELVVTPSEGGIETGTLDADAYTYVRYDSPTQDNGTKVDIRMADISNIRVTIVRFDLSCLSASSCVDATLRLNCTVERNATITLT